VDAVVSFEDLAALPLFLSASDKVRSERNSQPLQSSTIIVRRPLSYFLLCVHEPREHHTLPCDQDAAVTPWARAAASVACDNVAGALAALGVNEVGEETTRSKSCGGERVFMHNFK